MTTLHVPSPETEQVLREVALERKRQDEKWGEQNHRDGTGTDVVWAFTGPAKWVAECARSECTRLFDEGFGSWRDILTEEVAEAYVNDDPAELRAELVQVAAVAVAWVEAIDRRPTLGDVAAALDADGDPQGAEIVRAEAAE